MGRLIDENKLKIAIWKSYEPYQHDHATTISRIANVIDEQPTVEAVSVVHGEWETCEHKLNHEVHVRCSVCGASGTIDMAMFLGDVEVTMNNFCPNCGADMRGKKNE